MKKVTAELGRFVMAFFLIYGICEFVFVAAELLQPRFFIQNGALCLWVSAVLAAAHVVFSSELLDQRVPMKLRAAVCGAACVFALGYLTYDFGIQSVILMLWEVQNEALASAIFDGTFVLCTAAVVVLYYVAERRYCRIGKEYDAALAVYKEQAERKSTGTV